MSNCYSPKGLENLGLNCYMNSLLQCLYYCVDFRDYFLGMEINHSQPMPMCKLLKQLMYGLKNSKRRNFSPKDIKNELNNYELFKEGKEADASDLLDQLFYTIINEFKNEDSISETVYYEEKVFNKLAMLEDNKKEVDFNIIINKLFLGFYEKEYKCNKSHLKYSFQNEYRIVFPLEEISNYKKKKSLTIYDCFNYYYQNEQKEYEKCYRYKCGENSYMKEKIYEAPNILIIILDRGPNKNYKEIVYFDEYIDLTDYIDNQQKYKNINDYKLIGVITHLGKSGNYGHYISFCLCDDNNFYRFDDSYVNIKTKKGKVNSIGILYEGTSYVLFYQKLKKNEKKNYLFYDNIKNNQINSYSTIEKRKKKNIQINNHLLKECIAKIYKKYTINFIQSNQNNLIWEDKQRKNIIKINFKDNFVYVEFVKNYVDNSQYISKININNNCNWKMEWKNDEITLHSFLYIFEEYLKNFFL